jgi:DNA polymerase III alpha subunit (gram-positive type)
MMLLSLDFETTGLDFEKDRVIEVGAVLYSTGQKKCIENLGCLVSSDVPVTAEITDITGIYQTALDKFGWSQEDAYGNLDFLIDSADIIVGHNVLRFDKNMYESWSRRMKQAATEKLWVDTMIDIKGHEGKKLSYLAADHGIINPFPHSALADAQTVLTVVARYDIDVLIARSKTPTVYIQAHHQRSQNELVKKQKFRWNPQHKIWWKAVKETDIGELEKMCQFPIGYAPKEITHDLLSS